MLPGCSVNEVITADETKLIVAKEAPEEDLLLDIGIIQFEEGIPKNNNAADTGVYEDIRSAESRYIPYHLKTTLQGTGHWGAVRVIPSRSAFTDVIISGDGFRRHSRDMGTQVVCDVIEDFLVRIPKRGLPFLAQDRRRKTLTIQNL